MKHEGIEQAAELFREKIQSAQNSNNRSHDILKAIREFLADIGTNIPNTENIPANAQQEILRSVEELRTRIERSKS